MPKNYTDGNWHIWIGGKRPVPKLACVECLYDEGGYTHCPAVEVNWDITEENEDAPVVAFRVSHMAPKPAKKPAKPGDIWIDADGKAWSNKVIAENYGKNPITHFREVMDNT